MQKPHPGSIKKEGREARNRAQDRAGSGKIPNRAWYPELEAFVERGWRHAWIAEGVGLSERQLRRILQEGRAVIRRTREMPAEVEVPDDLRDLLEFAAEAFKAFYEKFSGFGLPEHCMAWVRLFVAHPNVIINTPMRHNKTTVLSIWLPVWLLCIDRNQQILIVSKSQRLATNIARSIQIILESEEIVRAFGRFAPDTIGDTRWAPSSGELMVAGRTKKGKPGDLSIGSFGMDQQILGFEATAVVCDDITDAQIARNEKAKEKETEKFRNEILSRITPCALFGEAGRALVVGQRVDIDDLYGDMIEGVWYDEDEDDEFNWVVDVQKAVTNWGPGVRDWDNAEPLWAEVRSIRYLRGVYKRLGSQAFETMMQQNPTPVGTLSIRPEWIEACKDRDRGWGDGVRGEPGIVPIVRVVSIDPSPSEWNAMVVADVAARKGPDADWACMTIEIRRWKGKGKEFKTEVERALELWNPDYLIVESSTFFSWFTEEVWYEKIRKRVKTLDHHTGSYNKNDEFLGADMLAADFEMKRISMAFGDEQAQAESQLLINEALSWPLSKVFDVFMALWFIKWNWKKLRVKDPTLINNFGGKNPVLNASGRAMKAEQDRRSKRRAA